MGLLRTLIIDDESLARKRLARLLSAHQDRVHIVGEANGAGRAIEAIEVLKPDLILLDIEMPGMNGFDLLRNVRHRPAVIFVTAYAEHAVRAFEEHALDYLLKPVEEERLAVALDRVGQQQSAPVLLSSDQLRSLADQLNPKPAARSIPVKVGDRHLFVSLDTVTHFEAREKVVYLHTDQGKEYITDHALVALADKLPPNFIRVHRAYIVNRDKIREIQSYFANRYVLYLRDHPRIKITTGPSYAGAIKDTLVF